MSKYGVSKDVVDRLVELVKSIPNPEDRYRGFTQVLLNFDILERVQFQHQGKIYISHTDFNETSS